MAFEKIDEKIEWNKDYCKLCNICIEICPINNLEIKDNKVASKNKCSGCKICEIHCPDAALIVKNEKDNYKRK